MKLSLATPKVRTLKAAAEAKNQRLYTEISSLDLIVKDFKVHPHCYQNFTRGFSGGSSSSNESSTSSQTRPATYDIGHFDKVKEYVSSEVVTFGKAVSMKTLHEMYELSVEDTRYRH